MCCTYYTIYGYTACIIFVQPCGFYLHRLLNMHKYDVYIHTSYSFVFVYIFFCSVDYISGQRQNGWSVLFFSADAAAADDIIFCFFFFVFLFHCWFGKVPWARRAFKLSWNMVLTSNALRWTNRETHIHAHIHNGNGKRRKNKTIKCCYIKFIETKFPFNFCSRTYIYWNNRKNQNK